MRFLLVDDDSLNLRFLTLLLAPYADCVSALSGKQAVDLFRQRLEEGAPFDAVFMDIMMPGTDGHTTVQEMRDIEQGKGVPFTEHFKLIMVSALSDVQNVTKSFFKNQADLYLTKPLEPEKVRSELKALHLIP